MLRVMVVGAGKVGTYLASLLLSEGYRVVVIEARSEKVAELQRKLPVDIITCGSGTDPNVLEAAGIRQVDVVAAVTGADETNLVITSLARFEFDVPRTSARVNDPANAWLFTSSMGVDVALDQAELMVRLIVEEMSLGDMMTLLKLRRGQYSLVEEKVHPQAVAVGKAIRDLDLPADCALVAIIRRGQLVLARDDTVLHPVDEVLALVHANEQARLAALLGNPAETGEGGASAT